MFIAGIVWGPNSKNPAHKENLLSISRKLIKYDERIVDNNRLSLISGKISANDCDTVLTGGHNILYGRAFHKSNSDKLNEAELTQLDRDRLVSDYWGKYLFIKNNLAANKTEILRDPTGQLPLFYHRLPDRSVVFASELSVIVDFLPSKPEYNWDYLSSYVLHTNISNCQETAFKNIYELPPGCHLNIDQQQSHVGVDWQPSDYFSERDVSHEQFIHTIESSLKAWVEPYDNLLLSMSGGLDSTALLYVLNSVKKPGQNLRALNYLHSQVKTSDESAYAQATCDDLGVELELFDMANALPFSEAAGILDTKPSKPFPALTHLRQQEETYKIVGARPSTQFFSGQGGDHIFLAPPPQTLVADYIVSKGFRGAKNKLEEVAHYYRTSIYQVIKENIASLYRHRILRKNIVPRRNSETWVTKELYRLGKKPFLHPKYHMKLASMSLGKHTHADAIEHAFASVGIELGDHNPVMSPLVYQPAVEMALSMPTYKLFEGGFDRYPFRDAISKTYNTEHVWRRSKGETSGILQLGIRKNLDHIMSLCLEGEFAKRKLVKTHELEQHILAMANGEIRNTWIFMPLISAEIFFSIWDK